MDENITASLTPPPSPHPELASTTVSRAVWRDWGRVGVASLASAVLAAGATWVVATDAEDTAGPTTVVTTLAGETDYARVATAVRDSVVAISVTGRSGAGVGSGVIVDREGHILTNHHVIAGAAQIEVTLADGRILPAAVVGTDESTDLAVVRLSAADDLVPAAFGTSADLVVGQDVIAVGNPLGLSSTVTSGIISALDRPVSTMDNAASPGGTVVVTNAIQVDAAINPGNSGGPIFDMAGRVIGIASSIATLSSGASGSIGLGFAIPVDLASRVAAEIIADGSSSHAFLGVSMADTVADIGSIRRAGALVRDVVAGSAADQARLAEGDVVIAINGKPVSGAESLTGYVRQYTPGTVVELEVVRRGTAETVQATLGAAD